METSKDSSLLLFPAYGMGYHSHVPCGIGVRAIRENLSFVLYTLRSDRVLDYAKLRAIVKEILDAQCADAYSPYCGVWPWYAEEPVERMSPPDRNWADFISALLLTILHQFPEFAGNQLRSQMDGAIDRACKQIIERNVGPDYTNICAMGAAVVAIAGERYSNPRYVEYARRRLSRLRRRVSGYDAFDEYNSPIYTPILILELERILDQVKDPACRKLANDLLRFAWKGVVEHFHAPTRQWAGPHGRNYWNTTNRKLSRFLGATFPELATSERNAAEKDNSRCPDDILHSMRLLSSASRQVIYRTPDGKKLTTWFTDAISLGTVDDEVFWTQRRPIIAYLASNSGGPCAVFRVRVLIDGFDFATARVQTVQDKCKLLAAIGLERNCGRWHLSLDRSDNNTYEFQELRIRFELQSTRLRNCCHVVSSNYVQLQCDEGAISIHVASPTFCKLLPSWEFGQSSNDDPRDEVSENDWFPTIASDNAESKGAAWVDAVFTNSQKLPLRTSDHTLPSFAFAVEVLSDPKLASKVQFRSRTSTRKTVWNATFATGANLRLKATPPQFIPKHAFDLLDPRNFLPIRQRVNQIRVRLERRFPIFEAPFAFLRRLSHKTRKAIPKSPLL